MIGWTISWEVRGQIPTFHQSATPRLSTGKVFFFFSCNFSKGTNQHCDLVASCRSWHQFHLRCIMSTHNRLIRLSLLTTVNHSNHPTPPTSPSPSSKSSRSSREAAAQKEAALAEPFECGLKSDNTRNGGTRALAVLGVSALMSLLTRLTCISTFMCNRECCVPVFLLVLFLSKVQDPEVG